MKIKLSFFFFLFSFYFIGQETVSITQIGQGKTKDEAIKNALRNAIEETSITFVTSNTTVINDQIENDEIITLSSGMIKKYNIISELILEDGSYYLTLFVIVSPTEIKTYCINKGIEIEFNGSTYAANIKLQKFYKKNEEKILSLLIYQLMILSRNSYNYKIVAKDPIKQENGDKYIINLEVTSSLSSSIFENIKKTLKLTLKSISLNKQDIDYYNQTNLEFFVINWVDNNEDANYYLRSNDSREIIYRFLFQYLPSQSLNFILTNNLIKISGTELTKCLNQRLLSDSQFQNYKINPHFELVKNNEKFYQGERVGKYPTRSSDNYFPDYEDYISNIYHYRFYINDSIYYSIPVDKSKNKFSKGSICILDFENNIETYKKANQFTKYKNNLEFFNTLSEKRNGNFVRFNFENIVSLDDLEKITLYKIEPIISTKNLQKERNINDKKIESKVEKQNIQNEISPNQLNSKNNTKTQEVKSENPKFKIGQTVGLIYYDNEIHASVLTIYQVIKIENKYFYKVKDEISNIQFNKLIPEENLYEDTGG